MTERPPVNVVNIATGICFVALGVLLMLHRAGTFELRQIIELWPLALVLLGSALVWQATRGGEAPSGSGGAIAALIWLGILGMLFSYTIERRERIEAAAGDGRVNVFALMGGDRRLDQTGPFEGGYITTVMGGTQLDLSRMVIPDGQTATLDLFTVFGGTELRVPAGWRIEFDTTTIAGGISDERAPVRGRDAAEPAAGPDAAAGGEAGGDAGDETGSTPDGEAATATFETARTDRAPHLVITGTVVLGGVTIRN